jgi:hypothetical protein
MIPEQRLPSLGNRQEPSTRNVWKPSGANPRRYVLGPRLPFRVKRNSSLSGSTRQQPVHVTNVRVSNPLQFV